MSSDDLGPKLPGAGYTLPELVGDLADETASVIELSGAIKWFDVSKGYGFIRPDDRTRDIFFMRHVVSPPRVWPKVGTRVSYVFKRTQQTDATPRRLAD